ncbi:MAG: hypothetical protein M1834_007348 [Cirrosporium novae-zelandiae]|nr:MAG: hypothetical protein M1834_007348 [Cirrosporium novae-zelandiae]
MLLFRLQLLFGLIVLLTAYAAPVRYLNLAPRGIPNSAQLLTFDPHSKRVVRPPTYHSTPSAKKRMRKLRRSHDCTTTNGVAVNAATAVAATGTAVNQAAAMTGTAVNQAAAMTGTAVNKAAGTGMPGCTGVNAAVATGTGAASGERAATTGSAARWKRAYENAMKYRRAPPIH